MKQSGFSWCRFCSHQPAWILAVVALLCIFLFLDYHLERWRKGLVPLNRPETRMGEGLVIRSDGLGYYAWLRSLLIDGDWAFDNEFDEHNPLGDFVPPPGWRTPLGRRALPWSLGPACWWALLVVPGHLGLVGFAGLPWPADGYSLPYQLLVGCGTLLSLMLTLLFLYGICRHFARPERAALAVAFVTLGTTLVYYGTIEVSMAHGVAAMTVAALVWYWLRDYGSLRAGRWFVLGLLLGVVALARWQLVTFAILPLGEAVLLLRRAGALRRQSACVFLLATGAFLGFLPQMFAWRCVYGQWLASPIATEPHWLTPSFGELLLTQERGLFYWTPMALLACLGYVALISFSREPPASADSALAGGSRLNARNKQPALLLLAAFTLQVYVLGSLWGGQVYLGVAFGFRHLTEALVVLAPGLALLLEHTRGRAYRWLCVLALVLVAWNLLLIAQYRYGLLPPAGGADLGTMAAGALRLTVRKKALLMGQVLAGPALLAWLYWRSYPASE